MRLDEFVASRIVEAVVHGIDLTDPLERERIASTDAIGVSARILDDLLARKTVAGRPTDLADDLAWIRAGVRPSRTSRPALAADRIGVPPCPSPSRPGRQSSKAFPATRALTWDTCPGLAVKSLPQSAPHAETPKSGQQRSSIHT